jgi:hypothetical protein
LVEFSREALGALCGEGGPVINAGAFLVNLFQTKNCFRLYSFHRHQIPDLADIREFGSLPCARVHTRNYCTIRAVLQGWGIVNHLRLQDAT